MNVAIAALLGTTVLCAADFSGKYKGALQSAVGGNEPVIATIRQQGDKITGTIGPRLAQQTPMEDAKVDDGKLIFRIAPFAGLLFTLSAEGETLSGPITKIDGTPPLMDRATLHRTGPLTLADTIPALPNEGAFRSIQILKLREQLQQNPKAVEAFWRSVKTSGTPLIDPDPSDDRSLLVTFLWQGRPEDQNVLLMWMPFAMVRPADFLMVKLPDTDVWFRTIRLPKGARLQYRLSPNDPLGTMPPVEGRRNAVKDPLKLEDTLLELPGASPQPWYPRREGVAKVTKYEHTLASQSLKQDRSILVYTPPNYDPKGKPYASVYLFDGEDSDGLVFATWTFENLFADKKIPPTVVVRIVNPSQAARNAQLSCQDAFFDFLAKELVPYVRSKYNVSHKPEDTAISGYSLGGLASAYAGLRDPGTFGLILAQSGSYWYEPSRSENGEPTWFAQKFLASPKLPLRFYMDAGLFEVDLSGRGSGILITNRHLRDVLRAKGYDVTYQEFPGGHDYVNWRGTLADGLIALFSPSQSR